MLLACTLFTVHAQTAALDRSEIFEGDIATLTVEYKNPILSLFQLQTDALHDDFHVLEVKPSVHRDPTPNSNLNIMRWQVALAPRRNGRLNVPSIRVRDALTPPLLLHVIEKAGSATAGEQIAIDSQPDKHQAWPGEQIVVTTRVQHNRPMPGFRMSEHETAIADRYLRQRRTAIDTPRDQAQHIAIFIDQPGTITLPAATLRAEIENRNADGNSIASLPTRSIYRTGQAQQITIRNPPEQHRSAHWLPASQLHVEQRWEETTGELEVGDSIAMTLMITATGLMAQALPEDLLVQSHPHYALFADTAHRHNAFDGQHVTATLEQSYLLVLSSPGKVSIADGLLEWWDVNENRVRVETIAGRSFSVVPAATTADGMLTQARSGIWIGSAAAVVCVAVACGWWFGIGRKRGTVKFSARRLHTACRTGQAPDARVQLILWARAHWPELDICGLRMVAQLCSPTLATEIQKLERALYAESTSRWAGASLWIQFKRQPRVKHTAISASLPDLYPPQVQALAPHSPAPNAKF